MSIRKVIGESQKLRVLALAALLAGLVLLAPAVAQSADLTGVTVNGHTAVYNNNASDDVLNANSSSEVPSPLGAPDPFGKTSNGIVTTITSGTLVPSNNTIVVGGNITDYSVIGGIALGTGNATGNTVTVNSGVKVGDSAKGNVAGGAAFSAPGAVVSGNNVTIKGTVGFEVFGGASSLDGKVTDNHVLIDGGTTGTVYGGQICNFDSNGDCITLTGTTIEVSKNDVVISGSTTVIDGEVIGGRIHRATGDSAAANVFENTVVINGGKIDGNIYGGELEVKGTVYENTVTINDFISIESGSGSVIGGLGTGAVVVRNNTVTINTDSTAIIRNIIGGEGEASISENTVDFKKGTAHNIFGGYSESSSSSVSIDGNHVFVSGGTVTGEIAGGYGLAGGNAKTNTVEITNLTNGSSAYVFGGVAVVGAGNANENIVNVSGSSVKLIYGGYVDNGTTNGNEVTVTNTTVSGTITGGNAAGASGNKLYLTGVEAGSIVGGAGSNNLIQFKGGENKINGTVTNKGTIEILAGQSTFLGAITNDGEMSIKGGVNTFRGAITNNTGGVKFTGGESTLWAVLTSAGDVEVTAATLILATNNSITSSGTNGLVVNDGGVIDVGQSAITLNEDAVFNSGSAISFGTDGTSADGKLTVASATFADGSKLKLANVSGDSDYWEGKTVFTASSITGADKVTALLYDIDYTSNAGQLTILSRRSFSDAADTIADELPSGSTPNFQSLAGFVDALDSAGASPQVIYQISESYAEIQELAETNPQLAEVAMRQLVGEQVLDASAGAVGTALKTLGVVYGRLDRIRELGFDALTPPAAGSPDALNRVWAGVFGVWSDQDARDHVEGYEFRAGGVSIGYDRKVDAVPGLRLGINANFSSGDWDKDDGLTTADVSTWSVGAYGSYSFQSGLFLDASLALGRTSFDMATRRVLGGTATADFDIDTFQYGLRAGYVFSASGFQFIPSVGVRAVTFKQDGFSEGLDARAVASGAMSHVYASRRDTKVDIPVLLKINTTIEAGSGTITPELRLGATFTAKRPHSDLTASVVGANGSYRLVGVRNPTTTYQAGLGVKIATGGPVDFFLNYDLDAGRDFTSHNGSFGIGIEF